MKQDVVRVAGLVAVVFVPELVAVVMGVEEGIEVGAYRVDLGIGKQADAGDVAFPVVVGDLFVGQTKGVVGVGLFRAGEELGKGLVVGREVVGHAIAAPLKKLEVYTFANCADRMCYLSGRERYPWLEHFANEYDVVARLGVLSLLNTNQDDALAHIDGPVYEQKGAWGHLLNEHYLYTIYDHLSARAPAEENPYRPPSSDPVLNLPRLYTYFRGGRPESLV